MYLFSLGPFKNLSLIYRCFTIKVPIPVFFVFLTLEVPGDPIYLFWLCWVFIAVCGLSLVMVSGRPSLVAAHVCHCSGFSCCGAWALGRVALSNWCKGLAAPWPVECSCTRDGNCVPWKHCLFKFDFCPICSLPFWSSLY